MSDRDCNTDDIHDTGDIKPIEKSAGDHLDDSTFNLRKAQALLAFLEDFVDDLDIGHVNHTRADALFEATQSALKKGIEQLKAAHTMILKERVKS